MQPAALPAPGDPEHGTDLTQPNTPARPRAPVSRRQIIGLAAGHLKGHLRRRLRRPGSARSLTRPAARHGHGSYQGNRRRQSRTPAKQAAREPEWLAVKTP